MKITEVWLREWVNPPITLEKLAEKLTLSGLEVEEIAPVVAEKFSNVVIGEVLHVEKHPEADRLKVCQVNIGQEETLTIVCGASNVRASMKVPVAMVGAVLPNHIRISRSKIRNIVSQGMLCSASELGLTLEAPGIYELPSDAPIGEAIWEYLQLSDHIVDIAITPNRGDCLSLLGMATEVSALTECPLIKPEMPALSPSVPDQIPIAIQAEKACPRYVGRVIRNVKADAITPIWMQERLRRAQIRTISAVVDIMNYVMLELGQPMHAFDLQEINGGIQVRFAQANEQLTLLDGQNTALQSDTLVIADDKNPLAIAGIMGGLDSSVTLLTKDLFLESAYFSPEVIAKTIRQFGLNSESSYRFERGIDPTITVKAMERASALLLEIVGGEAGPIVDVIHEKELPRPRIIILRAGQLTKILGMTIPAPNVESILLRLGFSYERMTEGWQVEVPERRTDITLEVDLIEEIIRLFGYHQLPLSETYASLHITTPDESQTKSTHITPILRDLGYQEIITYSFVSSRMQQLLDPLLVPKKLLNPMSSDMEVMRTTLWPGLIETLLYNRNRQQLRARFFEIGYRFIPEKTAFNDPLTAYLQQKVVSGLISGSAFPEQWGIASRSVDFFDLKGDIEYIFSQIGHLNDFVFKPTEHPATHPGQTAAIYYNDQWIGIMGALHPAVLQMFDLTETVLVFELLLNELPLGSCNQVMPISKFPEIRRDIAIFINESIPLRSIQDTIYDVGGELLKEVSVFDVYQGKGVQNHQKSIALALTLQHSSRTLVDEEVAGVIDRVITELKTRFAAELRG